MINSACLIAPASIGVVGGQNAHFYDQSGATKEYLRQGAPSGYGIGSSKKFLYRDTLKPSVVGTIRNLYEINQSSGTVTKFFTRLNSSNQFQVFGVHPSTGVVVLDLLATTTPVSSTSTWYTILCELDMDDLAKCAIYINDADQAITPTTFTTGQAFYVEVSNTRTFYGARPTGSTTTDRYFSGDRCETYLNFDAWLGIDTVAKRRIFNTAAGLPMNLGADGSLATGAQPHVYMPDGKINVGTILDWDFVSGTPEPVDGPNP